MEENRNPTPAAESADATAKFASWWFWPLVTCLTLAAMFVILFTAYKHFYPVANSVFRANEYELSIFTKAALHPRAPYIFVPLLMTAVCLFFLNSPRVVRGGGWFLITLGAVLMVTELLAVILPYVALLNLNVRQS